MASLPYAQWAVALDKIAKSMPEEQFSKVMRKVTLEALRGIVLRSPVGNPSLWKSPAPPGYVGGHFRNNWFVEIGGVTPSERKEINKSGSASLAQGKKVDSLQSPYVTIYIHNSLPYARRLEYGWSTQAPHGMVNLTAQDVSKVFRL